MMKALSVIWLVLWISLLFLIRALPGIRMNIIIAKSRKLNQQLGIKQISHEVSTRELGGSEIKKSQILPIDPEKLIDES